MRRNVSMVAGLIMAVGMVVLPSIQLAPPARAAGVPAFANQNKWAVSIGIDRHRNGSPRNNVGGVGDANDVAGMLQARGFPRENILVLTEGNATGANIRSAMQWLVDRSSPETLSVFHYSGHIKQIGGDKDKDGEALDEYLWPWDSNFIADSELARYMKQLRGWAWVDISGCEAAGLDDGINSPVKVFTGSSRETEKSYEYPAWRNSVWTGLMAERALGDNHADLNGDGRISLNEAFEWSAPQASAITGGQKKGTQHPYINGGEGSEIFLDRPPR